MNRTEAFRDEPRCTVEDFLQWEGDWELWRGTAVAMSPPPGVQHARVAGNLFYELQSQLEATGAGCRCEILAEMDRHVSDDEVLPPDLLIVCDPTQDRWVKKTPERVVEVVSPSSVRRDTIRKRGPSREAGVRSCVLADPETRKLRCLHLDEDGEYVAGPPGFELHDGCRVRVDPERVWDGLADTAG
ncbi:Uma2 family endonuclease [Phycisphaera mikurensis]|uniref:Uma2 family endonuclease n=1 Tax=Phycisphaera mikurensis TaxID=547188 RepID=UPI0021A9E5E6|nr:Uma2 family endonuclease [Phycisphaera mikurensis]